MKHYIRDCETGLYFVAHGRWVREQSAARNFLNSADAIAAVPACGKTYVEVVISFGNHRTRPIVDGEAGANGAIVSPKNATPVPRLKLMLFVAGRTHSAPALVQTLENIFRGVGKVEYEIETVDIEKTPDLAEQHQVTATPTLIRIHPAPMKILIGDLSDDALVMEALGLR